MIRGDDIWKQRRAELVRFIEEEGQAPFATPEAVKVAKQIRRRRVGVSMAIPKGKR